MNRKQFMDTLRRELSKLPAGEVEDILTYYEEYFDEAGLENEDAVIRELGSPVKIASQMKANYAVKQIDSKKGKKGLSAIWWVLLGVLAAPIAVPVAFTAALTLFIIITVVIGLAIAAFFGIGMILVVGIALVIAGITSVSAGIGTALVGIGGGLALIGLVLALGFLVLFVVKAIFNSLAKAVNKRREQKVLDKEIQARKLTRNAEKAANEAEAEKNTVTNDVVDNESTAEQEEPENETIKRNIEGNPESKARGKEEDGNE